MVSTAADYARFPQMLANGGQLDGVRLLSRKSIELMTVDHLPPDIQMGEDMYRFEALEPSARMGQGFGLTVAVRTDAGRNPLPGSVGDYYLGWCLRHLLLGRPARAPVRDLHDAVADRAAAVPLSDARHGVPGLDRQLMGNLILTEGVSARKCGVGICPPGGCIE